MPKSREKEIVKGMKVKELSSGRIRKVVIIDEINGILWLVSGVFEDMSVTSIHKFWTLFEEVTS